MDMVKNEARRVLEQLLAADTAQQTEVISYALDGIIQTIIEERRLYDNLRGGCLDTGDTNDPSVRNVPGLGGNGGSGADSGPHRAGYGRVLCTLYKYPRRPRP